jgi:cytochrome b561
MPKWKAIILYIGHLLFYILFIIGVLAIFILGLVIGPVAGIIALPLFIAFALIPYLKI